MQCSTWVCIEYLQMRIEKPLRHFCYVNKFDWWVPPSWLETNISSTRHWHPKFNCETENDPFSIMTYDEWNSTKAIGLLTRLLNGKSHEKKLNQTKSPIKWIFMPKKCCHQIDGFLMVRSTFLSDPTHKGWTCGPKFKTQLKKLKIEQFFTSWWWRISLTKVFRILPGGVNQYKKFPFW